MPWHWSISGYWITLLLETVLPIHLRDMVRYNCLFIMTILLCAPLGGQAQTIPRWEAGVGAFPLYIPYYRGSVDAHKYVIPYPVFRYRGDKYQVDEEGAHRWLVVGDRLKLNLSLAGGLPVPKNSEGARGKLDGLPATFEFGPRLSIKLFEHEGHAFSIKIPARVGFAIDFDGFSYQGTYYQGWVSAPFLHYLFQTWGNNRWKFGVATGIRYSNQAYQEYYYGVSADSISGLAPYHATGGYGGWWNSIAVYRKIGAFEVSIFGRYDFLNKASFEDSPLVETKRYPAAGMLLVWWFARSKQNVHIDPRDTY
jgi:outer membrane scaffolding protein for murein synthesis (MipA/OmpV family)